MSELGGQPPECIDVNSVTPDSVKSPTPPRVVSNAPDASASTNASVPERAGSPPPSCPICLGGLKNKCFTDSCLHQFCFNCLLEWSKIKAECPLCKQCFKSIIHNVKNEREFEEYLVQPLHYNLMLSEPFRYSYSTTLQVRPSQTEALQRLILHHPSLTDRVPARTIDTPNMRRRIYDRGLYALPLVDITGRARECSSAFYRANPAQVHRLIPFLNREAIHLISDPRRINSLMQHATDILTTHDITSVAFRRLMEPYFGENTVHFVHEFYNFARSPYDLYGYDNNVQYSQDYNLAINTLEAGHSTPSTSGSSSNRGHVIDLDQPGSSRTRGATRSAAAAAIPSTSTTCPWSYELVPTTVRDEETVPGTSSGVINVLSSSSSSSSSSSDGSGDEAAKRPKAPIQEHPDVRAESVSVIRSNPTAGTSTAAAPQPGPSNAGASPVVKTEQRVESVIRKVVAGEPSVKIELSDTDSDECQFVLERKPPHLRTPEYVSLNSDEDSDVVFVNQSTDATVLPRIVSGPSTATPAAQNSFPDPTQENRELSSLFRPYMYGMDEEMMAGTSMASMELPSKPLGATTELKYDPMLGASSSSSNVLGRRKRRATASRRNQRTSYDSSDEEQDSDDSLPISSLRARVAPVEPVKNSHATSDDSSSSTTSSDSEDSSSCSEYEVAAQRISPKKKEAIKLALTRTPTKAAARQRKRKRPAAAATRRKVAQGRAKRQKSLNNSNNSDEKELDVVNVEVPRMETEEALETLENAVAEESDEEEEENASNQGRVATSPSVASSSSEPTSDSEEIDVQNGEEDD